jgi:hypothetical protein
MSGLSFERMKPRRQHVSALGGRRFGVHCQPRNEVHEAMSRKNRDARAERVVKAVRVRSFVLGGALFCRDFRG